MTKKGSARLHASKGSRLGYDNTDQSRLKSRRRKSRRRKSRRRKSSKLQRAHLSFMKKELKKLNSKGGKPTANMRRAARNWKKSPQRKKAMRKSRRKKRRKSR